MHFSTFFLLLFFLSAAQPKVKRVKQPKVIRNATENDDEVWATPGLQQEVDQDGNKTKKEIKVRNNLIFLLICKSRSVF